MKTEVRFNASCAEELNKLPDLQVGLQNIQTPLPGEAWQLSWLKQEVGHLSMRALCYSQERGEDVALFQEGEGGGGAAPHNFCMGPQS